MPPKFAPKRQAPGAAAKRPAEAEAAKLIRANFTKFHRGKQRQALEALEEHNRAHPSGLGYLALSRMYTLLGMKEALQEENADEREQLLLRHLHKALGASVRGVAEHRSLQCVWMAAYIGHAVRLRGGELARERDALWEPLEQQYQDKDGGLVKDSEGWADPALEELPVDLKSDRWPMDIPVRPAARTPEATAKHSLKGRTVLQQIMDSRRQDDMMAVYAASMVVVGMDSKPVEETLVNVPSFCPEGPVNALRKHLESLGAQQRRGQVQEAGNDDRHKKRLVDKRGVEAAEARERGRQAKLAALQRKNREAQLKEAQQRADKLRAYLQSRMEAGREQEVAAAEASLPLSRFVMIVNELEGKGALKPEQAQRARTAAELMAQETPFYYSLPPALQAGDALGGQQQQQQQHAASEMPGASSGQHPMLLPEQVGSAIRQAAVERFSWEEQRAFLEQKQSPWKIIFDNIVKLPTTARLPDVTAEARNLFISSLPILAVDNVGVQAGIGDAELLEGDPCSRFVANDVAALLVPATRRLQQQPSHIMEDDVDSATGSDNESSPSSSSSPAPSPVKPDKSSEDESPHATTALGALEQHYTLIIERSSAVGATIGLTSEPSMPDTLYKNRVLPNSEEAQANHLLAQALLGHCMLRELCGASGHSQGPVRRAAAWVREAQELGGGQPGLQQLVEAAAATEEDQDAASRAAACVATLCSQVKGQGAWQARCKQPVEFCAALSLALTPRLQGESAGDAVVQAKLWAAQDILSALRHLQQGGRLPVTVVGMVLGLLGERGVARSAHDPEHALASAMLGLSNVSGMARQMAAGVVEEAPGVLERSQEVVAEDLQQLGRLPLRDLMHLHAYVCLHLAWQFPLVADFMQRTQEELCLHDDAQVLSELTKDGMLRIPPDGIKRAAQQKCTVAGTSEDDSLQATPAARQPGSSQGEVVAAAPAPPDSQEDWAAMLAAAACGITQCAAELQLVTPHAADAQPHEEEGAEEARPASQLATLQHAMALRALVWHLLSVTEIVSHAAMSAREDLEAAQGTIRTTPGAVVSLSNSYIQTLNKAPRVAKDIAVVSHTVPLILEFIKMLFDRAFDERELHKVELVAKQFKASHSKPSEDAELQAKLRVWRKSLLTGLDMSSVSSQIGLLLAKRTTPEDEADLDIASRKLIGDLTNVTKYRVERSLQLYEQLTGPSIANSMGSSLATLRKVLTRGCSRILPVLLELTRLADVLDVIEARLISSMRAECCPSACAAAVGDVLLHHVLPAKWEQDMAQAASAGDKLLQPGSSLTDKSAAEVAAAALLEQEEREAEAKRVRLAKLEKKKAKRAAQPVSNGEEGAQQQDQEQHGDRPSEAPASPPLLQANPSSTPLAEAGQQEQEALATPPETVQQQQQQGQESSANSAQQRGRQAPVSSSRQQEQQGCQAPASPTRQQQQQSRQPQENGSHTAPSSEHDSLQHFRARGDIEPGERPLPKLSGAARKGAPAAGTGKHGKHAAAVSPKAEEVAPSKDPTGGSDSSRAVQSSQARQAGADPSPGAAPRLAAQGQDSHQQQPASSASQQHSRRGQVEAASGAGTAMRQESASSQEPSRAGAARSSVSSSSSSTASSSNSSAAASRPASAQAARPQQAAASAHSAAGLGPAAAAATSASPAVNSSGPSHNSGEAPTAAAAPSAHSSSSLEAELAAQRRLAEQQGWIGPDGEIDITKLDELAALSASLPRGAPAAAPAPASAQPKHAAPGPAGRQGQAQQGPARQPAPAMVPPRTAPAGTSGAQGLREARPAAASMAPERPQSAEGASAPAQPAQQAQQPQLKRGVADMRFVRWEGEWMCHCGRVNTLRDDCNNCQQWAPCREWFLGRCAQGASCRLAHPPFDLPKNKPPTNERGLALHNGRPLANPPPGALYVKQAPPAKPAGKPAAVVPTWRGQSQPPQPPQGQQAQWAQPSAAAQRQPAAEPPAPSAWSRSAAGPSPASGVWAAAAAPEASGVAARPSSAGGWPAEGAPRGSDAGGGAPRASAPQPAPYAATAAAKPATGPPSSAAQPPKAGAWSSGAPAAALAAAAAVTPPSAQPALPAAPKQQSWAARAAASQQVPATPAISVEQRPAAGTPSVASVPAEEEELEAMLQNMGVSSASNEVEVPAAAGAWGFKEPQQAAVKPQAAVPLGQAAWPSIGQDQEDADLMAAMQASLADAAQQHREQLSALSAAAAAGAAGGAAVGRQEAAATQEPELARPALSNEVGEYNCFLNVIIQCLWYCTEFRQQVSAWPYELWRHNAVLSALRQLFLAFEGEEEGKRNRTIAAGARQGIDPTPLREALAALPHGQFKQGEMSDAAEVLDALYGEIKAAAGKLGCGSARLGVDALFGLAVRECVECARCGKSTHQNGYLQYFYTTQATSIRMQRVLSLDEASSSGSPGSVPPPPPSLGRLLHLIEQQARKTCDTDVGGCGEWNGVLHFLERPPRVFTLQLAWESQQEAGADIAATLAGIDEQVDLAEVYCAHEAGRDVYRLRSMVCYYGAHYQAFVLVPDLGRWLLFDDTRVSNIGTWADVLRKCELGRIQPSVLFYEAAEPAVAAGVR